MISLATFTTTCLTGVGRVVCVLDNVLHDLYPGDSDALDTPLCRLHIWLVNRAATREYRAYEKESLALAEETFAAGAEGWPPYDA